MKSLGHKVSSIDLAVKWSGAVPYTVLSSDDSGNSILVSPISESTMMFIPLKILREMMEVMREILRPQRVKHRPDD